jgi:hypothetical protein
MSGPLSYWCCDGCSIEVDFWPDQQSGDNVVWLATFEQGDGASLHLTRPETLTERVRAWLPWLPGGETRLNGQR